MPLELGSEAAAAAGIKTARKEARARQNITIVGEWQHCNAQLAEPVQHNIEQALLVLGPGSSWHSLQLCSQPVPPSQDAPS